MLVGFWRDSNELNEEQRLSLLLTQSVDFERCFARASAVGPTLIVARDAHDGAMVGIASIERAVADVERQTLHMRYDAEARLRAWHRRQKSDGDDDDDTEPSSPSPSSSAEDGSGVAPPPMMMPLDADEDARYLPVPIIANVAVAPSRRRSGIATALLRECFEEARDWGFDCALIEVEAENDAAVELYQSLGFREIWRAPRAALRVDPMKTQVGAPLTTVDDVLHLALRADLRAG